MKLASLLLLAALSPVCAQTPGPLMSSILPRYATAKANLVEAAEVMPAGEYSYRLTPPQRTFGEWIDHNVKMNYAFCSQAAGEPAPHVPTTTGTSPKAELVQALKDSFAYCDPIFNGMTDQKALRPTGAKGNYPVDRLVGLVANWNEHYGNLVGYLRTKGITPPSTARTQRGGGKK